MFNLNIEIIFVLKSISAVQKVIQLVSSLYKTLILFNINLVFVILFTFKISLNYLAKLEFNSYLLCRIYLLYLQ